MGVWACVRVCARRMNNKDPKKYSGLNKTVSRRAKDKQDKAMGKRKKKDS